MSDATDNAGPAPAAESGPAPGGALGTFLGMSIERPEAGRAIGTVTIGRHHHNPHGVAHVAADVHDEHGRLVALATGSFALLP